MRPSSVPTDSSEVQYSALQSILGGQTQLLTGDPLTFLHSVLILHSLFPFLGSASPTTLSTHKFLSALEL